MIRAVRCALSARSPVEVCRDRGYEVSKMWTGRCRIETAGGRFAHGGGDGSTAGSEREGAGGKARHTGGGAGESRRSGDVASGSKLGDATELVKRRWRRAERAGLSDNVGAGARRHGCRLQGQASATESHGCAEDDL